MASTTPILLRIPDEILGPFKRLQPGRGDLPEFVFACMTEYIRLWGDRPTPQEVATSAVSNVIDRFG